MGLLSLEEPNSPSTSDNSDPAQESDDIRLKRRPSPIFRIESFTDLLAEAQHLARTHGGQCLSTSCLARSQHLRYLCAAGHSWESSKVLEQGLWCPRCATRLRRAKDFAERRGGAVLDSAGELLRFRCAAGHVWTQDLQRCKKWCRSCHRLEKERARATEESAKNREEIARTLLQQQLFAEARKSCAGPCTPPDLPPLSEAQHILALTQQQLVSCYFHPSFSRELRTANYYALARALHPDKNPHPAAHDAFVAVKTAYSISSWQWRG